VMVRPHYFPGHNVRSGDVNGMAIRRSRGLTRGWALLCLLAARPPTNNIQPVRVARAISFLNFANCMIKTS
jgi:hypothetical protein